MPLFFSFRERLAAAWRITRAPEWWQHKIPVLVGVACLVAVAERLSFADAWPRLAIAIMLLVPVASYVCVLNDVTDEADDRAAGKLNRLAGRSVRFKAGLLGATIVSGAAAAAGLIHDRPVALLLYAADWIAFTLYSVAPIRLKRRGGWGVLADACGGQLLPVLGVAAVMTPADQSLPPPPLTAALALWALAVGIRAILFHQAADIEADRLSVTPTLVVRVGLERVARFVRFGVFPVEVAALLAMTWLGGWWPAWLGIIGYAVMLLVQKHWLGIVPLVALPAARCRPLLMKYYQFFLPLTWILAWGTFSSMAWILVPLFILLFPDGWRRGPGYVRHIRRALAAESNHSSGGATPP